MTTPLVSPSWLEENIDDPDLVVLYALLKGDYAELEVPLIPKSRCFDIKNKFSQVDAPFPNTIPSPEQFEREARVLGINANSKIVVYDHKGIYESPRVWWLFKTMGHDQVAILDGGLPEWKKQARPVDTFKEDSYEIGNFTSRFHPENLVNIKQMTEILKDNDYSVLDARSKGRFTGDSPEPRKGLSSGHMPGSFSLPFTKVLKNGKYKSKEELLELFSKVKQEDKSLVFSCGSGITACVTLLASEIAGFKNQRVFDGSWTEWASTPGKKIIKGE